MCGRNSLFIDQQDLESAFDATVVADGDYEPRYNIAPGDGLEVITSDAPDEIDRFHWGLIPSWADDPSDGIINARSETVDEKRVFQEAWESRPCLVPSSGFYEWQSRNGGLKQPYRIYREDSPAFAMAGIWDEWEENGESRSCVTILTTEPNDLMEPIHDRMPVVLPREAEDRWLSADPEERHELCQPYPREDMDAYPISTRVNDPSNDSPQVIEPEEHEQAGLDDFESE
ncbi:SOS response-associated peptidase [Halorhabdus rudnickae]|uniref:SOS response-associated peptidase n=1 Tax=Halorhabdus rudnickae TaxID=1775544 RepID=UPI001082A2F2|nr:SOS response-associated peptidase [Halorhabdus rudnickae]